MVANGPIQLSLPPWLKRLVTPLPLITGSPNYGSRAKSGPRKHFVNDEKIIHCICEKVIELVEYNISPAPDLEGPKGPGPRFPTKGAPSMFACIAICAICA